MSRGTAYAHMQKQNSGEEQVSRLLVQEEEEVVLEGAGLPLAAADGCEAQCLEAVALLDNGLRSLAAVAWSKRHSTDRTPCPREHPRRGLSGGLEVWFSVSASLSVSPCRRLQLPMDLVPQHPLRPSKQQGGSSRSQA